MTRQFDEFSKALASGMPRRKALKLFLAGVLGLSVAEHASTLAEAAGNGTVPATPSGGTCPPGMVLLPLQGINGGGMPNVCCSPSDAIRVNGGQRICLYSRPYEWPISCPPRNVNCGGVCCPSEYCLQVNGASVCISGGVNGGSGWASRIP